jgi:hypothetical protein
VAVVDPFDAVPAGGVSYRMVDSGAPAPPALVPEPGGATTLPPVAATPPPTATPAHNATGPTATPAPGLIGRVAGAVFGVPIPLLPEVLLVIALAVLYTRWKRRYYVEGPP